MRAGSLFTWFREAAATSLALVVHELATNSPKYGVLSVETGTLDFSGSLNGDNVRIDRAEHGGPDVLIPRSSEAHGSTAIRQTIDLQLGGSISCDWGKTGLTVTVLVSGERLSG